jgi:hypothetical protein
VHGFAFNSSVLWDPERWGRYPTSEPDKSQVSQPYHITTPFFIAHQLLLLYAYRRVAEYVMAHTSVLAASPLPCIVDYYYCSVLPRSPAGSASPCVPGTASIHTGLSRGTAMSTRAYG